MFKSILFKTNRCVRNFESTGILILILATLILPKLSTAFMRYEPVYLLDSLNKPDVIYFDFNKSVLKPESLPLLDRLANELIKATKTKLEIIGHSDIVGTNHYNLKLSKRRAEAVARYLISKGCNKDIIVTFGFGFSKPIGDNASEEGRSLNRRVEFRWITAAKAVIEATAALREVPVPSKNDEDYESNGLFKQEEGNKLTGEFTVATKTGEPYTEITEDDISAVLKWKKNETEDSTGGDIKLIPIDERKKIAFALTLDYSRSMYDLDSINSTPKYEKVYAMENAVTGFLNRMNQNNYAMLIKFGYMIDLIQGYTNNTFELREAVKNKSYPRSGTALFLSIYNALKDTTFNYDPTFMKTVVAFTDGEDNQSGSITKKYIIDLANKLGVKVYTIGMLDRIKHSDPPGNNGYGEKDLSDIAMNTGGLYYYSPNETQLSSIYTNVINQIKNSYSISIVWKESKLPAKGTPVKAIVRLNVKGQTKSMVKDYVW